MLDVTLSHRFDGFDLDVAFQAPAGITAIFGPSGSGKSTLLKSVAGLIRPQSGRIVLGDRVLFDSRSRVFKSAPERRIGVVFQEGRLFPHMSVRKNLTYGQRGHATSAPSDIDPIVDLLGIGHLLDRQPNTLSGGEAQRVAIGRALLSAPDLLLMDEPLASLDERRKAEILPYLERLKETIGTPILYVSHSLTEVLQLSNMLVVLSDGKVVEQGATDDLISRPELARHFGADQISSYLSATVISDAGPDGVCQVETAGGPLFLPGVRAESGTALRLRIPMRDVVLFNDDPVSLGTAAAIKGTVAGVGPADGFGVDVALQIGSDVLRTRITSQEVEALGLQAGMLLYARVRPADVTH